MTDETKKKFNKMLKENWDGGFKLFKLGCEEGRQAREKEILEIIILYFDMCMGARKVPKKEELIKKINQVVIE